MLPAENQELYRFLAQNGFINGSFPGGVANNNCEFSSSSSAVPLQHSFCSSSSYYSNKYGLNNMDVSAGGTETNTTASPHDRALAALNNHKEAEKRRRERINSHLDKLRSLLPCNSKTDKASLLAKVVERVKELKQQMSEITELETLPSEADEITVLCSSEDDDYYSSNGGLIFKASLSCEDRPELLPDLIEILKSLHLKTLRAEMATLGGRIRSVLIVAADKDHTIESVPFLQNAFKSLLERSNSSERSKRRRRVLDPTLLV